MYSPFNEAMLQCSKKDVTQKTYTDWHTSIKYSWIETITFNPIVQMI